jgi:hypothetical protein
MPFSIDFRHYVIFAFSFAIFTISFIDRFSFLRAAFGFIPLRQLADTFSFAMTAIFAFFLHILISIFHAALLFITDVIDIIALRRLPGWFILLFHADYCSAFIAFFRHYADYATPARRRRRCRRAPRQAPPIAAAAVAFSVARQFSVSPADAARGPRHFHYRIWLILSPLIIDYY